MGTTHSTDRDDDSKLVDVLTSEFAGCFMQPRVTERASWLVVTDSRDEATTYPSEEFSEADFPDATSVETVEGHGAQLSAPGYLDCTDWAVFDTVAEAVDYLREAYGSDDE